nr:hypothetical protein [Tanacetum cinerariifolium]
MANVPPNDPNVDAPAIVPALDAEEEEEDPKEDPEEDPKEELEDDDDDMEMDDEEEVIDLYMDDGSNNPPPPNSEGEETPPTSPVIPDADGMDWKRLGKMEKLMSERIDTEGRIKKKFKEQDHHFLGLCCDNIKMDRTVRNVMSDLSGLKKLVKGLSDQFDGYERSKVFDAKRMLQNRQKSKGSVPLPLGLDAAIADAAIATSGIDDDDDDTAPMDSQPHEPRESPRDTQYFSIILAFESVEAVIRDERERVQNEANRAEGPNVAPVARECTFTDFMKCSPITFRRNEGAVGLIRWIEKTKMVFTVSKCTEANKVVFAAATFQDRALT